MSQSIKVERGEAVTRIIIDRPEKLNALSASMMATIAEAVECTATPVLVISGNGDKTFCAGADIGEFSTGADALARQETAPLHMIAALARSPSLTITLAHGRVMGAGGILTTLSDVVLARDDLSLGFPEIRFGMYAASTSAWWRRSCLQQSFERKLTAPLAGTPSGLTCLI